MFNLQLTHLHFHCRATTAIQLGSHYAGNNLRNALANVMLRATCPDGLQRGEPTAEHAATCPACWLLTANLDPGTIVRAYAVVPPRPARQHLPAGDPFAFALTIFGTGFPYLPYFVLAVNEMGQQEGIGPGRREGGGRFVLEGITAVDPLRGDSQTLYTAGDGLVQVPDLFVDWTAVAHITQLHLQHLPASHELTIHFHTPTRLEEKGRLFKTPDFAVFFHRLLYRLDELNRQFAAADRRPAHEIQQLHQLADKVRLVETNTQWHELWTRSGRKSSKTPISGFTGTAVYRSDDWAELMPWLILGQAAQVGQSVVKGNGVYELRGGSWPPYWDWLPT